MGNERKETCPSLVLVPGAGVPKELPPIRPKGCRWEFWAGAVAIDRSLTVWETGPTGGMCVGRQHELEQPSRIALANYMIALWTKFRDAPPND